ncbi:hypothetical protein DVA67_002695 [Solirubrobacter sp. CPCC 204708]|uniref:Uncharacterized protein n=1 Tax=Solirubrobacter deserti TaxID=2282478 RepID=A0ABT4RRA0_9ACTN|nr:hypothetical protein [Solirubrobacter deserti]MBE2314870.1 hypothetical protein [Solirubrobacter deserti]MDA0141097.1 hypothetical protein [Solirubrobacter deserti]
MLKVTGVVAVGALAIGAGVLSQAGTAKTSRIADGQGGLLISPLRVDRQAVTGATDRITIANRSPEALTIEVKARPWSVSSSGDVAPNRRSTLGGVRVSEGAFTLAPNQTREVDVALAGAPAGGSLYGALEVVGLPTDLEQRKGVVTGYRLVGALRYHAATKRYALSASSPKVSKDQLLLPVRSTGNTNAAVRATVEVKGATGTRRGSARAAILPGKRVSLNVLSAKTLRAGRYTVKATLRQGTLRTTVTKTLRVKR